MAYATDLTCLLGAMGSGDATLELDGDGFVSAVDLANLFGAQSAAEG